MKYRHFRYIWDFAEEGAATVAIDLEDHVAAISVCSSKDQFCKRTGRENAMKRIGDGIGSEGHLWIFVPDLAPKNKAYYHFSSALTWLVSQMYGKYERITVVKGERDGKDS